MKHVLLRTGYDVCRIVRALNKSDYGAADHRIACREDYDSGHNNIETGLP